MSGDVGERGGSEPYIRDAIDVLAQAAAAEGDEVAIQTIQTCMSNLQSLLANAQKEQESALQGKATPGALSRMTG